MRWYKAKEHQRLLLDPRHALNAKYTEYDTKIPDYEGLVAYLDEFLARGVTADQYTWSDKAKKDMIKQAAGSTKGKGAQRQKTKRKESAAKKSGLPAPED